MVSVRLPKRQLFLYEERIVHRQARCQIVDELYKFVFVAVCYRSIPTFLSSLSRRMAAEAIFVTDKRNDRRYEEDWATASYFLGEHGIQRVETFSTNMKKPWPATSSGFEKHAAISHSNRHLFQYTRANLG